MVLISFDALTAQDMSLYGYGLPTTPQFERLAQRSYNFVNFVSTSDFTTPAVASLLTGQYPLTNRVFQLYGHIPHRLRKDNIAWILRQHGYTTAAIVTNPAAHPLALRLANSFSILPGRRCRHGFFLEPSCCSYGIACCSTPPTALRSTRSSGSVAFSACSTK